jgi:hypothetical protein
VQGNVVVVLVVPVTLQPVMVWEHTVVKQVIEVVPEVAVRLQLTSQSVAVWVVVHSLADVVEGSLSEAVDGSLSGEVEGSLLGEVAGSSGPSVLSVLGPGHFPTLIPRTWIQGKLMDGIGMDGKVYKTPVTGDRPSRIMPLWSSFPHALHPTKTGTTVSEPSSLVVVVHVLVVQSEFVTVSNSTDASVIVDVIGDSEDGASVTNEVVDSELGSVAASEVSGPGDDVEESTDVGLAVVAGADECVSTDVDERKLVVASEVVVRVDKSVSIDVEGSELVEIGSEVVGVEPVSTDVTRAESIEEVESEVRPEVEDSSSTDVVGKDTVDESWSVEKLDDDDSVLSEVEELMITLVSLNVSLRIVESGVVGVEIREEERLDAAEVDEGSGEGVEMVELIHLVGRNVISPSA